jgi:hypothetical protein
LRCKSGSIWFATIDLNPKHGVPCKRKSNMQERSLKLLKMSNIYLKIHGTSRGKRGMKLL